MVIRIFTRDGEDQTKERILTMKTLLAILAAGAVLLPGIAEAGKYSSKRTECSSYTYITGTTKTTCRTR